MTGEHPSAEQAPRQRGTEYRGSTLRAQNLAQPSADRAANGPDKMKSKVQYSVKRHNDFSGARKTTLLRTLTLSIFCGDVTFSVAI